MATKKKPPKKKPAGKKKVTHKKPASKKKAVPKKKRTVKKRRTIKKKPAVHKSLKRRDATGHLNPGYAQDLRRASRENQEYDDDRGFLIGKNADDALGQELGREFVETVTSGEDEGNEVRDKFVTEEVGGPFVPSTRGQEVAEEADESNPEGATREPFPKTSA
jgi:hypothetical protein